MLVKEPESVISIEVPAIISHISVLVKVLARRYSGHESFLKNP